MDSTVIIASNIQIGVVFLTDLFIIYSAFRLFGRYKDLHSSLSFVLASSSAFMSFGYLMLYTSTYERTGSYSQVFNLCNNLAFGSSILTFISLCVLISTYITAILRIGGNIIIYSSLIIPILSITYTFKVTWDWYEII